MKTKLSFLFLVSFIFYLGTAQVPQGFNYQAVAHTSAGAPISNASIQVKLGILSDTLTPVVVWEELHSTVKTNPNGVFTIVLGGGVWQSGSASSLSVIDWSVNPLYLRTQIFYQNAWKNMGSAKLWSVPYALTAGKLGGPVKKLAVTGETTSASEALFEVKNKDGQTVFAVYNEGVRIYVSDGTKAVKGGFAVGGFGTDKAESTKYLFVGKDSVRIYLDSNPLTKGTKSGFAVGGYDLSKGTIQNYLDVSEDSVRVYIDNNPATKGKKGGFAVGGYDITKGEVVNFLNVATDTLGIINPSQNRLLWYPQKNAFLTGKVLIEKPDSVGVNSFASGFESKAIGDWSQALGYKAVARGHYSTAIGNNTNANSPNSFAFGNEAKVTGSDSYAFGTGAIASGISSFALGSSRFNDTTDVTDHTVASADYAFALGFGSAASSTGAFAMGVLDSASGPGSLSMGYFNRSRGWFSTTLGAGNVVLNAGFQGFATGIWTKAGNWCASSFGDRTYASGHTSFATGFLTTASGHLSTTFGDNTVAPSWSSFAIGKFNAYSGSAEGWSTGDPIFMVGIGSSTSDRRNALTVYKSGVTEFNKGTMIDYDRMELNYYGTGNRYSYIDFHSDNTYTDYSFRIFRNTGANGTTDFAHRGTGNLNLITYENSSIAFTTYGAERMRIRGYNGFVGINTNYPTYMLDVAGSANLNKGNSEGVALCVDGNEALWYGKYTDSYYHFSWGYGGSYNVFNSPVTVGGIYNPGSYKLNVNGTAYSSGGWSGSDRRWKKDLEPVSSTLNDLLKLQGYKYYWRVDEYPEMNFDKERQLGLIAQDVEKVYPELVKTDDKGYKAVSYEKLTVILLESIKEQQAKIEKLEEEISEMKEEIASSR
jgi:hypothetical protein